MRTPSIWLKAYLSSWGLFLSLDIVWLGVVARNFYHAELGELMSQEVHWVPAVVFYALYLFGLLTFVVEPAVERGSPLRAAIQGGLFGLVTYQTYELTNLALIRGWPWPVVLPDIAWGTVLSAVVASATTFFTLRQREPGYPARQALN